MNNYSLKCTIYETYPKNSNLIDSKSDLINIHTLSIAQGKKKKKETIISLS